MAYWGSLTSLVGLPRWHSSQKKSICQCSRHKRWGLNPWGGKIPWSRKWQPTPVFLPRELHGQRSLGTTVHGVAKESDTTEQLSTHITLVVRPFQERLQSCSASHPFLLGYGPFPATQSEDQPSTGQNLFFRRPGQEKNPSPYGLALSAHLKTLLLLSKDPRDFSSSF